MAMGGAACFAYIPLRCLGGGSCFNKFRLGQVGPQPVGTLGERLSVDFHRRYEGSMRPVLWEGVVGAEPEGLRWAGYTDNYIRVMGVGPADLMRRVTSARLSDSRPDGMWGVIEE